jgi:hypothetical protein
VYREGVSARGLLVLVALCGCPAQQAPKGPVDMAVPPPICDDGTVGTDAAAAPTLANVQRVFDERCVGCHCCDAYLKLFDGVSRDNLVGRAAATNDQNVDESCGGTLVAPGDAGVSYLYQKISTTPCAGEQMPRAETVFVPLPACEQDLIRRWIESGAPAQ